MGTVSTMGAVAKVRREYPLTDIINVKYMDEDEERAVPGSEGEDGQRWA